MSNEENEHHKPQPGANPEIRYVPVDMRTADEGDKEIDLIEILKMLWDGRRIIFLTTAIFVIMGLIVALLSCLLYTSPSPRD